ncbi:MAG: winged helix-turn-helix transcriptional regulator [Chloroflexi bacterium]|nr:winged helix-turn-helix transcriptional regulator [Chloroflexota bacterium]
MSTRDRILKLLVSHQRQSINDLAKSVGINPISVRHHINRLEADGSVESEEERHGVGRPRRIYFLTESGMELFPSRYLNFSARLLDQIKKDVPKKTLDSLLRNMAGDIADDFMSDVKIEKLNIDDRLELLEKILTREGFTVDIEKHGDKVYINETSCPYIHVGQDHHEVCILDETLIHKILGAPVEQIQCMLDGDGYCTYEVPIIPSSKIEIRS